MVPGTITLPGTSTEEPTPRDHGYYGPGSATWRMTADPLTPLAGVRALLLQGLNPVAMRAVSDHSTYRERPWERLVTTGDYLSATTYGTRAEADAASAVVRRIHTYIGGHDDVTGTTYRADDPDLLLWVHNALVDSQLAVIGRGRTKGLDAGLADDYVQEQVQGARFVGLDGSVVPASVADLADYMDEVRGDLMVTRSARESASYLLAPPLPGNVLLTAPARPLWAAIISIAYGALPGWARGMYALPGLPGRSSLSEPVTTAGLRAMRVTLAGAGVVAPELMHPKERYERRRARTALATV